LSCTSDFNSAAAQGMVWAKNGQNWQEMAKNGYICQFMKLQVSFFHKNMVFGYFQHILCSFLLDPGA
jgi:hypothetical protein